MTTPTYEEATICPRCKQPGEVVSKNATRKPGVQAHMVYCRTSNCPWENTPWVVQVNADGSVPPPQERQQAKMYPNVLRDEDAERIVKGIQRQLEQEQQPGGGEVGRRR